MSPYTSFEQQVDLALLTGMRGLHGRIESDRVAADERWARFGKQVGVVTAAVRELELAIAELSSQALADSHRGLERHVSALQADVAARLDYLTDRISQAEAGLGDSHRGLERHVSELEVDVAARLDHLTERMSQAEVRMAQLEAPALVSDRARFASLSALHRAHLEVGAAALSRSRSDGLDGYELRGLSQNGEDGVLAEILARIGAENRFFVEFGIESGREGNCVYLAQVAGWDGLFIEADPDLHRELSKRYAANGRVQTVQALVTPGNVEQLFADAGVPESLDILSIDVDGADYWIWEALEAYRPRIVVIEYNSALPADARLVQPRDHGRLGRDRLPGRLARRDGVARRPEGIPAGPYGYVRGERLLRP